MVRWMRPLIELSIARCHFEEWCISKWTSVTWDDGTLDMRAFVTKYTEFTWVGQSVHKRNLRLMLRNSESTSDLLRSKIRQKSIIKNERSHFSSLKDLVKSESGTEEKGHNKFGMNPALDESTKLSTQCHHQITIKQDNELTKSWAWNRKTKWSSIARMYRNQHHASSTESSKSEKDSNLKIARFVLFEGLQASQQSKLSPQVGWVSEQSSSVNLDNVRRKRQSTDQIRL
jgi:hypothetical protein